MSVWFCFVLWGVCMCVRGWQGGSDNGDTKIRGKGRTDPFRLLFLVSNTGSLSDTVDDDVVHGRDVKGREVGGENKTKKSITLKAYASLQERNYHEQRRRRVGYVGRVCEGCELDG